MQNINANLAEKCSWCITYKDETTLVEGSTTLKLFALA